MLILLLCAAMAVIALWPQTPAGRFLRRWLVEAPARRLTPGVLIFATFLLVTVVAGLTFARAEGWIVATQGAEAVGWFVTFDVGTYIDVIAVAWLLAASVRLRAAAQAVRGRIRSLASASIGALRARRRAVRHRRRRARPAPPPSDEGRGWAGLGFAYA